MTEEQYIEIIKHQQAIIDIALGTQAIPPFTSAISIPEPIVEEIVTEEPQHYSPEGFEEFCQNQGLSKNTVSLYTETVKRFFKNYKELNTETLKAWEDDLIAKWKLRTINIRQSAMLKYFKYVGFEGYTFKRFRIQHKAYSDNIINDEQYKKLLDYTIEHNCTNAYKIIRIIASTGVRVSELIGLKSADLLQGYTDLVSKENKQRRIYYPPQLIEDLKDKCPDEYMVSGKWHHKQITSRGVSEALKSLAEKAGVPRNVVYPHSFRHYYAKTFIKNGGDITLLGDLLGHSNISTTALYTRKTAEEQKQAVSDIVKW